MPAPFPATGAYIDAVNPLGRASTILYAVPAALVLVGIRRLVASALVLVGLALLAVGVTMYSGGPITAHLTAILVSAAALAGTVAALVRPAPATASAS